MKTFAMTFLATVCVLPSLVCAGTHRGTPARATLSELSEGVQAARDAIINFDVRYRMTSVGSPGSALTHDNRRVVVHGDKFCMERDYGYIHQGEPKAFARKCSYDGERGIMYQGVNTLAVLDNQSARTEFDTEGSGYFDLMLYYPCRGPTGRQPVQYDLLSLIASEHAAIAEDPAVVNGVLCDVVDVTDPRTMQVVIRLYVSAQNGYLPIRQEHYSSGPVARLVMTYDIVQAQEIAPSVWMPTLGFKRIGADTEAAENQGELVYRIEAVQGANGEPAIAVNIPIPPSVFELWNQLPAGTRVSDFSTGQMWMVSSNNFAEVADARLASLNPTRIPQERSTSASEVRAARAGWLTAVPLTCAVCAWSLFARVRRKPYV